METGQVILSQLLPKTGQTDPSTAGTDGAYQAGWWRGRTSLTNKTRFISKTIGDDVVIIDRATGLIWAADDTKAGCNSGNTLSFTDAITYAEGLTFAGFSDWRMPNVFELVSIQDMSRHDPCIYIDFFPNCISTYYWTSTTDASYYDYGINIDFDEIDVDSLSKVSLKQIRCVRGGV